MTSQFFDDAERFGTSTEQAAQTQTYWLPVYRSESSKNAISGLLYRTRERAMEAACKLPNFIAVVPVEVPCDGI